MSSQQVMPLADAELRQREVSVARAIMSKDYDAAVRVLDLIESVPVSHQTTVRKIVELLSRNPRLASLLSYVECHVKGTGSERAA